MMQPTAGGIRMSYGSANVAKYREVEVLSLSPARRLVLLYTHLLSCLRQGHAAILTPQPKERVAKLLKAHAILEELRYTLNHEEGGQIADSLASLYEFFMEEVLRASREPDAERLARVVANIAELHDAFSQAAEQLEEAAPVHAAVGA
jgi:flagellar protein FliS